MKVWELKLDKIYKTSKNSEFKYKLNPAYRLLRDAGHGYLISKIQYNDVVRLDFEEIQQPMTFQEAMEWMSQNENNITLYGATNYCVNGFGDLCFDADYEIAPVQYSMIKGQWYKV